MFAEIAEALAATLSPSKELRAAGEAKLSEHATQPGFLCTLLTFVTDTSKDATLRMAGSIYCKNLCKTRWRVRESRPDLNFIPPEDKAIVRENMLDAIVSSPVSYQKLLCEMLRTMIDEPEFPSQWTNVPHKLSTFLESDNIEALMGACLAFYQIAKFYEFKNMEERAPFDQLLDLMLPRLYSLLNKLLQQPSAESMLLSKLIMKIYFRSVQYLMPPVLSNPESFGGWMQQFLKVLAMPVEQPQNEDDKEDWPKRPVWKAKKWACHILKVIYQRYGIPSCADIAMKDFAQYYTDTWCVPALQVCMHQLDVYRQGQYISQRVLALLLQYLQIAVAQSKAWKLIKPQLPVLIEEIIYPLMCHSEHDEQLWQEDPYEYIRVKHDTFLEAVRNPVYSSELLIGELAVKRGKQSFNLLMTFIHERLKENAGPQQVDGALHMVGLLASELRDKKTYRPTLEPMLVTYVFPLFQSELGFLRAQACRAVEQFARLNFKQKENVHHALEGVLKCLLQDKELPVKVEAGIALRALMQQPSAQQAILPHLGQVVETLLILLKESEADDLNSVLEKLISLFGEALLPYAVQLSHQLAQSFISLLDYEDDGSDEEGARGMTALGVLQTLQTLLDTFSDQPTLLPQLEQTILPVLSLIIKDGNFDFLEEALDACTTCTNGQVSESMWQVFGALYQSFKTEALDYFPEMTPVIHNLIRFGGDQFLIPQHINSCFDMCRVAWEYQGNDFNWHSGKIMEMILLYHPGRVDDYLPAFVGLAVARLWQGGENEIKTKDLLVMAMNLVIAGLYYNPILTLQTLDSVKTEAEETLTSKFMALWFSRVKSFTGLHNRKLGILALTRLISMPFGSLPPAVQRGWAHILPVALELFSNLENAYQAYREEMEDEDDDDEFLCIGNEDDDNDFDEFVQAISDDEDAIDDFDDDLDPLAGISWALTKAAVESEDPDGDGFGERQFRFYETPIDNNVDEYIEFSNCLQALQQQQEVYSSLVQNLTPEQQQALHSINTKAQQHVMAARSAEIEQQGGYSFDQSLEVPKQFSFG